MPQHSGHMWKSVDRARGGARKLSFKPVFVSSCTEGVLTSWAWTTRVMYLLSTRLLCSPCARRRWKLRHVSQSCQAHCFTSVEPTRRNFERLLHCAVDSLAVWSCGNIPTQARSQLLRRVFVSFCSVAHHLLHLFPPGEPFMVKAVSKGYVAEQGLQERVMQETAGNDVSVFACCFAS